MIEKQVMLSNEVLTDMEDISDFIIAVSRPSHAERYIFEILAELNTLSYLGAILQKTKYGYPKRFHPEAKMLKLHNKPMCAIFHIDGDYVIVDRILHSSMITY
ncbi:MAG: type II toxin-antitoxin system RelE/ParE family toxin [Bacteroidales bacterium]|nr:type II toxin-antitoxin system RelE/ParE family toxin [Bacteroidales bacterium]